MRTGALLVLLLAPLVFAGCRNRESVQVLPDSSPMVASGNNFSITAGNDLRFSLIRLKVKPGEEVTVKLTNVSDLPKKALAHNFVLLKKGVNPGEFVEAAERAGFKNDFFPESMADDVIAHTKLLGPKESDTIKFKAPTKPGYYIYVCTFTGHYNGGMKGYLVVK